MICKPILIISPTTHARIEARAHSAAYERIREKSETELKENKHHSERSTARLATAMAAESHQKFGSLQDSIKPDASSAAKRVKTKSDDEKEPGNRQCTDSREMWKEIWEGFPSKRHPSDHVCC